MAGHKLIGPVPGGTPADSGASRSHIRAFPYDLLKEAADRLGIMSLLAAALWLVGTVLYHLAVREMTNGDPRWIQPVYTDGIAAVCMLVSIALFFYTRRDDRNPRFTLDLGLVYMVFTTLALSFTIHAESVIASRPPISPTISWGGAVILMAAAIVPNAPAKTLIAGLIAASMNPMAMLVARARGHWDFGPATNVLVMHYPDYLLVGVSVVISLIVTRLGQQVTKAREMGSYKLVSMLGQGGMGEVWRASHRMLARDAAIKLIQPETLMRSSGENAELLRRRFEQEARATASLRSPHTVQLYDFGVTEDGAFYYVMELLDGIDLETLIKKFGPQPPARAVYILRQICRSLADAHRQGLVHRDIKPTNIFLCRMGSEYDFAKVLDFGLVKVVESKDTRMTLAGATTGTPSYMAPELALGNSDLDGRTDLYGLGCVAYWLITGGLVFEEKGSTAMILAHLQKRPAPISERSKAPVSRSLEHAIMMCLEKQPGARPASVEILARLLDRCDEARSWTGDDAERWWKTNVSDEPVHGNALSTPADTEASAAKTV